MNTLHMLHRCFGAARRVHSTVHPVFRGTHGRIDPYNALTATFTSDGQDEGALAGWPVSIKENIALAGSPTTCSSRMLLGTRRLTDYVSPFDAAVVSSLREAGAYLCARTNCDEFAMGFVVANSGLNIHSVFGAVSNPAARDEARSAGGSSGGGAAAVAADLCRMYVAAYQICLL